MCQKDKVFPNSYRLRHHLDFWWSGIQQLQV